jgi:hypothetical protein
MFFFGGKGAVTCTYVNNSDSSEGTLLKIPLEAMPGSFQDPFFSCDPPPPLPNLPNPLAVLYPSPSYSFARSLSSSPVPSSFGSSSGLLVGASVKVGFWRTLFQGKLNVWQALATAGVQAFFNVCFLISLYLLISDPFL